MSVEADTRRDPAKAIGQLLDEALARCLPEIADAVADRVLELQGRRAAIKRELKEAGVPRVQPDALIALFDRNAERLRPMTAKERANYSRWSRGENLPKLSTAEADYAARGGDPTDVAALPLVGREGAA